MAPRHFQGRGNSRLEPCQRIVHAPLDVTDDRPLVHQPDDLGSIERLPNVGRPTESLRIAGQGGGRIQHTADQRPINIQRMIGFLEFKRTHVHPPQPRNGLNWQSGHKDAGGGPDQPRENLSEFLAPFQRELALQLFRILPGSLRQILIPRRPIQFIENPVRPTRIRFK